MKKSGSVSEFADERDAAVMDAYRRLAAKAGKVDIITLSAQVARQPAPRFWVSEERAATVVAAMGRRPDATASMLPSKQRMFSEISRRVDALRPLRPGVSLFLLVSEVVNQPAPEFYLSPRYVGDIIYSVLRSVKKPRIDR